MYLSMPTSFGVVRRQFGKAIMKRAFSLFLAALMLLSVGCGVAGFRTVAVSFVGGIAAADTGRTDKGSVHADLRFDELPDDDLNISLEIARTEELLFRIERGELSGIRARDALTERENAYRDLCTAVSVAYVRYCLDVTDADRKAAYDAAAVQLEEWNGLLIEAERMLSDDPALKAGYDDRSLKRLERAGSLYDPQIKPLLAHERELVGAYETAAASFTVSDGEREWTKDEILSDPSLGYEAFMQLYDDYLTAYNAAVGAIFSELIEVRNRIAAICGYPSYAEYGYAKYDRDYSTADAQLLAERIRQTVVPLFREMQEDYYDAWMRLSCGTFYREVTVRRVGTAATRILPELSEPWTYMTSHGLYNLDASTTRMPGSFTVYFVSYGAPFLFASWDDSYGMPATLLHEFGHYASYYINGGETFGCDSLDLAEVDSQGLEMLAVSQYDLLYGALSDAAETLNLFNALYVLISGCVEDAFQQYAYHTEGVTTEMLNNEYDRLCEAYGLKDLGLSALSWTEVPHTFQSPMYYISYCTGMMAALQLYHGTDRDTEAYRTILHRQGNAGFRETVNAAGLTDPFDPEATGKIVRIAERAYDAIKAKRAS